MEQHFKRALGELTYTNIILSAQLDAAIKKIEELEKKEEDGKTSPE